MGKVLNNINIQKGFEGDTKNIKDVLKIYNMLMKLDDGHIWEDKWSCLVRTKYVGDYPYKTFYYVKDLYYLIKE